MSKKTVLYVLTDGWCEWECSYAVDILNSYYDDDYEVKTISVDGQPQRGDLHLGQILLSLSTF